jgi:hypothetical protein
MTDPAERLAGPGVFGGVTTGPAGITGAETRRAAAGVERTPEGQQTGVCRRVKHGASRRLRRSLTGPRLTRLAGLLWPGRAQPRQKETLMNASTVTAPTEHQLRYLRALAARTGSTFTYPSSRRDASEEIDRLRRMGRDVPTPRSEVSDTDAEHLLYATAVHASEVSGFGASATWRAGSRSSPRPQLPQIPARDPAELARYTLSTGERVVLGRRTGTAVTVTDRPASGDGRSYLVERVTEEDGEAALHALVADYLAQAHELDEVPMARGAVRQLFGEAGPNA